jgi:hypothetical protein
VTIASAIVWAHLAVFDVQALALVTVKK